jgi:hypothetical protein
MKLMLHRIVLIVISIFGINGYGNGIVRSRETITFGGEFWSGCKVWVGCKRNGRACALCVVVLKK